MTARHLISILATCAAVAGIGLFAPVFTCGNGRCEAAAQTAESKPMKLRSFMRKPVASSATSTVRKKKSGEYTKASAKSRAKPRTKQRTATPEATPEAIPAGAAQAFASSYELARVRVVTPETTGSGMLADKLPVPPLNAVPVDETDNVQAGDVQAGNIQTDDIQAGNAQADNVQVVSADEVNDIDRKADATAAIVKSDSPGAIPLDSLSRDLAGSAAPKAEDGSWFQRMLLVLGGAFAAAVTMVKTVLG